MSFLSSLKRLFFTTESVTKSAIDKATVMGKEKVNTISDGVEKIVDNTKDLGEKVFDRTSEAARTAWDSTKIRAEKMAEKTTDFVDKAGEITREALDNVSENADTIAKTAWDSTKSAAGKVMNTPTDFTNKASEKVPTSTEISLKIDSLEKKIDAAESVEGKTNETLHDIAEEEWSNVQDTTTDTAHPDKNNIEKAKDFVGDTLEKLSKSEWVQKSGEIIENVGEKVIEKGDIIMNQASDLAEDIGEKVVEKSDKAWHKISEIKDSLHEKAQEVGEKLQDKFNETVEKAEAYMAEENAKPKKEFSDNDLTTGPELLEGSDDFFSKASHYADGHHDVFSEGKIKIEDTIETAKKQASKIAGAEDLDGDGNEMIDDAQIVDEDK